MKLRVLRYFLTVAREENLSNAADRFHITQPTLSRQMMELEKELGSTVFLNRLKETVDENSEDAPTR